MYPIVHHFSNQFKTIFVLLSISLFFEHIYRLMSGSINVTGCWKITIFQTNDTRMHFCHTIARYVLLMTIIMTFVCCVMIFCLHLRNTIHLSSLIVTKELFFFLFQHQFSDTSRVMLRGLTLKSSGLYRCEISAEGPSFASVQAEGRMEVVCKQLYISVSHTQ